MASLELFAERMRYWCNEGDLGYDQTQRWDIREGGESDCSSLVIHALQEAGFDTGEASYTGDLSYNLTQRGWKRLPPEISTARLGDILLSDVHHVAAVIYGWGWWATIGEAFLDENGGIYYGQSGDQTGLETRTTGIYDFPWDCILRYEGDDMQPHEVWEYNYENSAPGGNVYNSLMETAYAVAVPHDSAAGDGTNGSMKDRVDWIDKRVRDMSGQVEEIYAALKADMIVPIEPSGAIDYDKLAEAVADKLAVRLKE